MSIAEFVYTVLLRPAPLRRLTNATLRAIVPAYTRIGGAVVWLNPADPVVSGALALRLYEPDEIRFFCAHISDDMTFVDVGANVGLYTGLALATPGFRGRILAVEPHAESGAFLARTIQSNDSREPRRAVHVCAAAASDRRGTVRLYKNADNKGDNRLYPDELLGDFDEVPADTLDHLCASYGIDTVQFLKLDVQGAEALVVRGASGILSRSADCLLMSEFWPYGLMRAGADGLGYLELLEALGFALFRLPRQGKRLVPIGDPRILVAELPGRRYANLIGLKGGFRARAQIQG